MYYKFSHADHTIQCKHATVQLELQVRFFQIMLVLQSLKIVFTFTNVVDPNKMLYLAAFYVDLHLLQSLQNIKS